jgi:hypothetical protein
MDILLPGSLVWRQNLTENKRMLSTPSTIIDHFSSLCRKDIFRSSNEELKYNKDMIEKELTNFTLMKLFSQLLIVCFLVLLYVSCGAGSGSSPDHLQAKPSVPSQITLTWDAVPGAERYQIYRLWWKLLPVIVEKNVTQTFFQDSGLRNNIKYHYQVSAIIDGREGPRSTIVSATTHPGQVRGLEANLIGTSISVKWRALPGFTAYRIDRETDSAEAAPASFQVQGNPPPIEFVDPSPPPGLTSHYFIQPISDNVDYAYSISSFATVKVPGAKLQTVTNSLKTEGEIQALVLKAEGQVGGVALSWSDQGPEAMYSLTRESPGQAPVVLDEGLLSTSYWDGGVEAGRPMTYKVQARSPRTGNRQSPPVIAIAAVAALRPDSTTLRLSILGQPEQQASLQAADRNQAFRGLLIILGHSPQDLPRLVAAAGNSRVAILYFGAFNFGTSETPRFLTTKEDPNHQLSVLDLRRPALSSRYLQAALEEAIKAWPDHPELSRVPLAGWAFSQTDVSMVQVLSRPEWKTRVAALIHANALELNATVPLFSLTGVPQLLLLSGRYDTYSQLLNGLDYTTWVNRESYLHNLITIHRMPMTIVSNSGKGHSEGLDHPYVALWLSAVFAQRSTQPMTSWQGRIGWMGGYRIEKKIDSPWGDGKRAGVRLVETEVGEGIRSQPGCSWFPSRKTAEKWKEVTDEGAE